MACLEHDCHNCDWMGFSNSRVSECPKCGSPVTTSIDEEPEHEAEEDDDGAA